MSLATPRFAFRTLIIDDDEQTAEAMAAILAGMDCETEIVSNGSSALKCLQTSHFDIVFLDMHLGNENGMDLMPKLFKVAPHLEIIFITGYASIAGAVAAMQNGAVDYISKPFDSDAVRKILSKLWRIHQLRGRVTELESRLTSNAPPGDLVSTQPAMQLIYDVALRAAVTPANILLLGESGTGKTVLANNIHAASLQKENAFVTVSCPSLSRELLESELFGHVKGAFTGALADKEGKVAFAANGTLFLDEIGELPLDLQPKLLRLLQEKEYERVGDNVTRRATVRVIAATNRNLEKAVEAGRFREDLFYRLSVIVLTVPPLRDRPNDILPLAESHLNFFARQCAKPISTFCRDSKQALLRYSWPGNLRELRNVIERAVILAPGDSITLSDLPERLSSLLPRDQNRALELGAPVSLEKIEMEHIDRIIRQAGSMEAAAKILEISAATLYRKKKQNHPPL